MEIDYEGLKFWVGIGQWVFNVIVGWYLWVSRSRQATNERVSVLEDKVVKISADMEHMPGQQQFKELNDSITSLNGNIQKLEGRFEGVNRAVDLINECLINEGFKK